MGDDSSEKYSLNTQKNTYEIGWNLTQIVVYVEHRL